MKKIINLFWIFILLPTLLYATQYPGIPKGWSDGYVYANGIRLHYYRAVPAPDKPVIVMVHGVTDIGLSWTTLTQKLQGQYDIYMLDTRGHGLSDPFTSADNGETLIKDVVEFVRTMKINNPILMGHSMGAATVMRVGAEYPELAKSIIMLDPILANRTGGPRPARADISTPAKANIPTPAPKPNTISVNMFGSPEVLVTQNNYSFDDLVALGHRQNPLWDKVDIEYWALSKKQYHGPYTPEASQAMSETMNIGNSLQKIKVPAIIVKADASPEVRKANEEMASVMQKGRLIHIDGAGHNLHHDKLEKTYQILKQFLSAN